MPDITLAIDIDQDRCTQCGTCIALCMPSVFDDVDGQIEVVDCEACSLCGHCIAACPNDAITHSAFPLDECPLLDPDTLPALDSLVTTFRERRSHRVFRDQPVPRETVRQLVDAARWVPSANNAQAVDWLAFDNPNRIASLSAQAVAALAQTARLLRNPFLLPILKLALGAKQVEQGLESAATFEEIAQKHAEGQDPIFRHAPVVLVAHVPDGAYFGRDDTTYAVYNLMLAAQRLGLGTCQIGYFTVALDRSRQLRETLGLPEGRQAAITLILGYPRYPFWRVLPRRQPDLLWNPES